MYYSTYNTTDKSTSVALQAARQLEFMKLELAVYLLDKTSPDREIENSCGS